MFKGSKCIIINKEGVIDMSIAKEKEINFLYPESQEMYRRLVEALKNGIYMADAKGDLFYVNYAFADMLGYSKRDEVLGRTLDDVLYDSFTDKEAFLEKMKKTGSISEYETKHIRKDGIEAILSITCNYIYDDNGKVIGVEGVVHDVTEKRNLEEELLAEKRKLEQILHFDEKISSIRDLDVLVDFIVGKTASILEAKKCSLMLIDEDTRELYVQGAKGMDQNILEKTRIKLGESIAGAVALERTPVLVKNIEYDKRFQRVNRPAFSSRSFIIVPIWFHNKLIGVINVADKKPGHTSQSIFGELDLRVLSSIAREIAAAIENVRFYKDLNFLTVSDPLTQMYNYRYFIKSLDCEIKRFQRVERCFCMMMIDIDDFKSYNDSFGHLEGDALLKEIGHIFDVHSRETDVVCRYAGDEFVIILPETCMEGAKVVAQKVKEDIETRVFKKKVTVSIGIAEYIGKQNKKNLIRNADKALYQAKNSGKNRICAYPID